MATKAEINREEAEWIQRNNDRKRSQPVAFSKLARDEDIADLFFQGLRQHYIECLLAGRLDVWATAAHSAIDLMANPTTPVARRH